VSKAKAQGTSHESWIVKALTALGLTARRLAEGGSDDEGDVEAFISGRRWVLEGKARQTLNVQQTLGKARKKAGGDTPVAVVWKRLVRVPGMKNRQPVEGERIVVILSWDDFESLVQNAQSWGNTVYAVGEDSGTIQNTNPEEQSNVQ
jgi:hypothetical protein